MNADLPTLDWRKSEDQPPEVGRFDEKSEDFFEKSEDFCENRKIKIV